MDVLKLNIAAELKSPGKESKKHIAARFEALELYGRSIVFSSPVKIDVTYVYDGDAFDVAGSIDAVLRSTCARCDTAFDESFHLVFHERFVRHADDDSYEFAGDILDLSQMICDNILLHVPLYSVCMEGCKGLCPVCGCNLNEKPCACILQDELFDDDKEV